MSLRNQLEPPIWMRNIDWLIIFMVAIQESLLGVCLVDITPESAAIAVINLTSSPSIQENMYHWFHKLANPLVHRLHRGKQWKDYIHEAWWIQMERNSLCKEFLSTTWSTYRRAGDGKISSRWVSWEIFSKFLTWSHWIKSYHGEFHWAGRKQSKSKTSLHLDAAWLCTYIGRCTRISRQEATSIL